MSRTEVKIQFILWIFLIPSCIQAKSLDRAPRKALSSLEQVVDSLSALAQIVNGIALQEGFSSGSIKQNDVIAELLHLESGEGFEKLKTVDVDSILPKYMKIVTDAGKLATSPVDPVRMQRGLEVIGNMSKNVEEIKTGSTRDYTDVLTNMAAAVSVNVDTSIFETPFLELAEQLEVLYHLKVKTGLDQEAIKKAFNYVRLNLRHVIPKFQHIKKSDTLLGPLWKMIGSASIVEPLTTIVRSAEVMVNRSAEINSIGSDMKSLKTDFQALQQFFTAQDELKKVGETIGSLTSFYEEVTVKRASLLSLAAGFRNGGKDLISIPNAIRSKWVREKIAGGKDVEKLVNFLKPLTPFSNSVAALEKSWSSFRLAAKREELNRTRQLFQSVVDKGIPTSEVSSLEESSKDVGNCLITLQPLTAIDSKKFWERFEQFKKFDADMKFMKESVEKINNIKIFQNLTFLTDLNSNISQYTGNELIEDFDRFGKSLANSSDGEEYLKGLLETGKLLAETDRKNWDDITNMKTVLSSTNLGTVLDCQLTKKFNDVGIAKVVAFGANIRTIGQNHKNDTSIGDALKAAAHLKSKVEDVEKSIPNSSRNRRATDKNQFKMENSQRLSKDFGTGVILLNQLKRIRQNKMIMMAGLDPAVIQFINSQLRRSWKSEIQPKIQTMLTELDELEKFSSTVKDGDLQKIGGLLEKASAIQGIPIDRKLVNDQLVPAMKNSSDPKVSGAAANFETIGSLELDFAKHQTELRTAAFSLADIQKYFDRVFGISRSNTLTKDSEERSKGPLIGYMIGAIALLAVILILAYFCIYKKVRKVQDLKKARQKELDDFNNPIKWLYQKFTKLGEWHTDAQTREQYQALHHAILTADIVLFEDCVEKRANVNACCRQANGFFASPLHLCVQKNLPNFVDILLKNGADPFIRDSNHKTVWECALENPTMKEVFLKNGGVQNPDGSLNFTPLHRKTPPEFTSEHYRVYFSTDKSAEERKEDRKKDNEQKEQEKAALLEQRFPGYARMKQKFGYQVADQYNEFTTHLVVLVDPETKVLKLEESNKTFYMKAMFSGKHLMQQSWVEACLADPASFANEFRVEKIEVNGRIFETCSKILRSLHDEEIPLLAGAEIVAFANFDATDMDETKVETMIVKKREKWNAEKSLAGHLGAANFKFVPMVYRDPTVPFESMYYREDMGPMIILYREEKEKEKLLSDWWYVTNCNRYTIFSLDEFYEFLLTFKKRHFKLGTPKDNKTILEWEMSKDPTGDLELAATQMETYITQQQDLTAIEEAERPTNIQDIRKANFRPDTVGRQLISHPTDFNRMVFVPKYQGKKRAEVKQTRKAKIPSG